MVQNVNYPPSLHASLDLPYTEEKPLQLIRRHNDFFEEEEYWTTEVMSKQALFNATGCRSPRRGCGRDCNVWRFGAV